MATRTVFVLLLMAACLALGLREAKAHAALIGADPSDGTIVAQAPARIVLHFNEPVAPLVLRLIDPRGEATDLKRVELRHLSVEIMPPGRLGNGTYVLSWRVVSEDGHPIGGSLVFSVGAPSGGGQETAAPQTSLVVRVLLWSVRVLVLFGLFIGVGGAFFAAWIVGPSKLRGAARRIIVGAIRGGVLAAVLSVGIQGLDALAAPLGALADPDVWLQGWRTSLGTSATIAVAALVVGRLSLDDGTPRRARVLSGVALIGMGVASAASGHAGTAEPQWLTRTSVFVHVTGLAFWVGALVPLFAMLRGHDPRGVAIMNRFSAAILPVVIGLVIAGAILAVVQVESVEALWNSAYGNLLLLKLLAVGFLLALAAVNRLVFTPASARGDVRPRFAQSIAAEGVLVLLILGLVAGWRFTPPPRAGSAMPGPAPTVAPEPASVHIHGDDGMAQVTLSPGRAGRVSAMITLASGRGAPLEPKEVAIAFSNPAAGIEPLERRAARAGRSVWRVDDLVIPVPGRWLVRVDALVSDFDKLTLQAEIDVR
jgi:copper transport protein